MENIPAEYAELARAIESAGFVFDHQPQWELGDRMVCATSHSAKGLHCPALRVSVRDGQWYIDTISSPLYEVPRDSDIINVALTLLREGVRGLIPRNICDKLQLRMLDDVDHDRIYPTPDLG